ncbi:hypothetical protein GQR58_019217 [Nymphon striatum]|nr:hypothetical protein GQR58_019217 [Nymphon striatum]
MKTKTTTLLSATLATTLFAALSTSQVAMANESVLDLTQTYLAGEKVEDVARVNYSIDSSDFEQKSSVQDHLSLDKSDTLAMEPFYLDSYLKNYTENMSSNFNSAAPLSNVS